MEATVHKREVLFYDNGRNEMEIVLKCPEVGSFLSAEDCARLSAQNDRFIKEGAESIKYAEWRREA
jgi:hypothetical protein